LTTSNSTDSENPSREMARPLTALAYGLLALLLLTASTANALHIAGTEALVTAQFGGVNASDSSLGFSSTSITAPGAQGEASASARYNGPLRVEADSAPDGVGAFGGDSMVARAMSATVYHIDAVPGGPAPGTLIDIRLDYGLTGRFVNIGNHSSSRGSIAYGLVIGSETELNIRALNGFLTFGPGTINLNDFGLLDPIPQINIATGNPFVDIDFSDSFAFQAIVGQDISVQAILQAVSGTTMRVSFGNTASFNLVPITAGVEVNVLPIPEPSTTLLLGLGLASLAGLRPRNSRN